MSSTESNQGDARKPVHSLACAFDSEHLRRQADQAIQSHYAPDSVIIDVHWNILQFRGRTGFYLQPARGEAAYRLLSMTREDLRPALRKAVSTAIEKNIAAEEEGICLADRDEVRKITLRVLPLENNFSAGSCFLVIFEQAHLAEGLRASIPGFSDAPALVEELLTASKRELANTREYLHNIEQEYETALEELRAANDELGSANEELHCKNDELGTAKENLQSANEELLTVNREVNRQNCELKLLSDDLVNVLNAIQLPILMVDRGLRLRRFTAMAQQLFHLGDDRIGDTLADLGRQFSNSGLAPLARQVIDELGSQTRGLQDGENKWWSLTVRPYRTGEDRINGALLIFTDIDVLKRNLGAVQDARDYADTIIDTVGESLIVLTPDLEIRRANRAFYRTFRLASEQTIGKSFLGLEEGLWDLVKVRQALESVLSTDTEFSDLEIELNHSSIGLKSLRLSGRLVAQDGSSPAILLSIVDATEQERARRALVRSNEELQNFAAVIAHDLQEPLRTVGSYTQLLARRYKTDLDTDTQELSHFVTEGVLRLQPMIRDLLEYAQVTQTNVVDRQSTSATTALKEALANLGSALSENNAQVGHSELPMVVYNPRQLIQLFQNLLGNAVKYRRANVPPYVQVTASRQGNEWVFSVRDNGIGFAPEHAQQIFGVFKRLQGRDYAGTGIGLSICQRIVEHHHGRIWAESEPGVGSNFSFSIPIADE